MRKNSLKIVLCLLFVLLFSYKNFACSCAPPIFSYCGYLINNDYITLITFIDSLDYNDYSERKAIVLNNVIGNLGNDTITIKGQDGFNCGESLNKFEKNDTVLVNVLNYQSYNPNTWFLEGFCGITWLRYHSGYLNGLIYNADTSILFEQFVKDLPYCFQYVSNENFMEESLKVNIFPNPTRDFINIEIFENNTNNQFFVYDYSGNLVFTKEFFGCCERFDSLNLIPGNYIVQVQTPENQMFATKIYINE